MVRHESDFTSSDLKELRRILGKSLDAALPGMKIAAAFYKGARERQVSSKVRTELLRLKAVLEKLERTATALSPDAMLILERTFDHEAAVSHSSRRRGQAGPRGDSRPQDRRSCRHRSPARRELMLHPDERRNETQHCVRRTLRLGAPGLWRTSGYRMTGGTPASTGASAG